MCNCTKKASGPRRFSGISGVSGSATQEFVLSKADGTRKVFGSKLEADAENARNGYTGIVKPKGK